MAGGRSAEKPFDTKAPTGKKEKRRLADVKK